MVIFPRVDCVPLAAVSETQVKVLTKFLLQAQLASLMALSTQGGEVPLRLFAQHQATIKIYLMFLRTKAAFIQVFWCPPLNCIKEYVLGIFSELVVYIHTYMWTPIPL